MAGSTYEQWLNIVRSSAHAIGLYTEAQIETRAWEMYENEQRTIAYWAGIPAPAPGAYYSPGYEPAGTVITPGVLTPVEGEDTAWKEGANPGLDTEDTGREIDSPGIDNGGDNGRDNGGAIMGKGNNALALVLCGVGALLIGRRPAKIKSRRRKK